MSSAGNRAGMNMDMPAPALLTKSLRRTNEGALKAALAANDLRRFPPISQ
jgi:hypothetical protein